MVNIQVPIPRSPRSVRGRRLSGKANLRRLLDAAGEEFGTRGYHDTAISNITQGAGVGLGTFYVYFKSKEEVFRALVADMGARTRHAMTESTRGAHDRLEAERLGIQAFIDFVRSTKLCTALLWRRSSSRLKLTATTTARSPPPIDNNWLKLPRAAKSAKVKTMKFVCGL